MSNVKFRSAAHRDFFLEMMSRSKVNDTYHRAFFYVWVFLKKREQISIRCLTSRRIVLSQRVCTRLADKRYGQGLPPCF